MARNRYTCIAPDGKTLECTSPDYVEHTVVVIGLMRLRKPLPKINPDDDREEIRYDRFKAWVMIGGAADVARGQRLAEIQGYRGITEETLILPVTAQKVTRGLGEVEDDEEPLKVEESLVVVDMTPEHKGFVQGPAPQTETPCGVLDLDALE